MVFDTAFLARVFPRLSLMSFLLLKEPVLGRLKLVRLRFGALQSLAYCPCLSQLKQVMFFLPLFELEFDFVAA